MKDLSNRLLKIISNVALATMTILTLTQCDGMGGTAINGTSVEITMPDSTCRVLDFYSDDIVRVFQDPQGGAMRDPVATPPAQILVLNPRRDVTKLTVKESATRAVMTTPRIKVVVDKVTGLMTVTDRNSKRVVFEETAPATIKEGVAAMTVKADDVYLRRFGVCFFKHALGKLRHCLSFAGQNDLSARLSHGRQQKTCTQCTFATIFLNW